MRDILLTAAIAAALIGGYIVMGKLDGFLAREPLAPRPSAGHPPLRIGFTDPLLAGSLPALPGGDVRLFSGTADALLLRLSARELQNEVAAAEQEMAAYLRSMDTAQRLKDREDQKAAWQKLLERLEPTET